MKDTFFPSDNEIGVNDKKKKTSLLGIMVTNCRIFDFLGPSPKG